MPAKIMDHNLKIMRYEGSTERSTAEKPGKWEAANQICEEYERPYYTYVL